MPRQSVAVIGSGISGLSAAWLLSRSQDVTLFEASSKPGGHANTVEITTPEAICPVDTGFIVYNEVTYPNLTALFRYLGVTAQPSSMTFSASFDNGSYEYSASRATGLFAQKANLLNHTHWLMIADIVRFFRNSPADVADRDDSYTLAQLLDDGGYSGAFTAKHIVPMGACIWSMPLCNVLEMPARTFVDFFENHGLLQISKRPPWRTVNGGSQEYVRAILEDSKLELHLNKPIERLRRSSHGVRITSRTGEEFDFNHAVLACHSDQALALLDDPDEDERKLLGAIRYAPNRAVLHTDPALMPKRRNAWASWNYLQNGQQSEGNLALTYWMNALQNLPTETDVFVTLNPPTDISPDKVIDTFSYTHPIFDQNALRAQKQIWRLQGQRKTWYCGAWCGSGFHEDGLQAGLAVAEQLGGISRPWQIDNPSSRIFIDQEQKPGRHVEAAE